MSVTTNPFFYTISGLSQDKEYKFKQLTYGDYKEFNKSILSNDCIVDYIDVLIKNLCIDPIEINNLTILDKFFILTYVCSVNVHNNIQSIIQCTETKKEINCNVSLTDILQKIIDSKIDHTFSIKDSLIVVDVTLPKKFTIYSDYTDLLINSIHTIHTTTPIPFHTFSNTEKQKILSKLPNNIVTNFINYINKQDEKLKSIKFIDTISPHVSSKKITVQYSCSLLDNSLLTFLTYMFKTNLKNLYVKEFNTIQNLRFSLTDIMNITPIELDLYNNIFNKSQQKQNQLKSKNS